MLVSLKEVIDQKVAEEEKTPIIIQIYPRLSNEKVGQYLFPAIIAIARKQLFPLFEENVKNTKHILDICEAIDVSVEGELGHVVSVNDDAMEEFTNS